MTDVVEQPSQSGTESAPSVASLFAAPDPAETTQPAEIVDGTEGTDTVLAGETDKPLDENAELLKLLPADDGMEEIDYEGEKHKIPAKLKDAFLRQADYTRKTQEVAEHRRAVEQEREQHQQQVQFQQTHIKEIAQLTGIDERLQQFAQVNWQALNAADPVKAQALHIEYTQLQAHRGQLVGSLTQKNQQMQLEAQRADAKRANDAEAVVMREIKDWSPEKYRELQTFGQSNGIEPETLRRMLINVPQSVKLIDKALQYDKLLKQRSVKPPPAPVPKPVTRVGGGGATNTKTLSEKTPEEYAVWRRERNARR